MKDAKIREVIAVLESIASDSNVLTNLINSLRAELPKKVWEPTEGDFGWAITAGGWFSGSSSLKSAQDDYAQGNLKETKELAKAQIVRRAATHTVLTRIRELENGPDIDWDDNTQAKYCLDYSKTNGVGGSTVRLTRVMPSDFYSTDIKAMEQAAKEMPEEIKLMLGVES